VPSQEFPLGPPSVLAAERVLAAVRYVEEPILIPVLLIDLPHTSATLRQDLANKEEDGSLRRKLDALADNPHKLSHGYVIGDEELLFVDVRDGRVWNLLHYDRNSLWVFGPDFCRFRLSIIEGIFLFELPPHCGCD